MTTTTEAKMETMVEHGTERDGEVFEACGRCDGKGEVTYGNIVFNTAKGARRVCFACHGTGGKWTPTATIARREKDRARRAAKREATMAANLAAFEAVHPEAAEAMAFLIEREDSFGYDVRLKAWQYGAEIHPNTLAAVVRAAQGVRDREARQAEREAAEAALPVAPVPAGRQVVTGEIVGLKSVPGFTYGAGDVLKMVVRDDRGFKVYGTAPLSLGAIERGLRVTFTAALEASKDDETFGFFKRPTKAEVLEA